MARYYLDSNSLNPTSGGFIVWDEKIKDGRSPKITLEADRSSATRVVDVEWSYWAPFATAVLGYTILGNVGAPGTSTNQPCLLRSPPWAIPLNNISQNRRFLFADKMDIEGLGVPLPISPSTQSVCFEGVANNAIAVYQRARCTV
ncbi:MAG TPA: hypothetical protein VNT76_08175, partial [Candidatus Binatus sp.]|nr:hypothetical protein [Candidatus Binatus sp.]